MIRISSAFSSLFVVAALGACVPANEVTTRAELDPLGFRDNPTATVVEIQADALANMGDQLVRDTMVRRSANSALIDCGLAIFTPGRKPACGIGAERRAMFGRDRSGSVELVPAVTLVDSIQDMSGQMDTLETGLPDLLAAQNAALDDLNLRRDAGTIAQADYETQVAAIAQTRSRIDAALAETAAQAEQANLNMQTASNRGQAGLGWHLSATAQIAQEAEFARTQIGLLEQAVDAPEEVVASNVASYAPAFPIMALPRSGEYR